MGWALDQGAHAHGDKLDILPVAIANINLVNVANIAQNILYFQMHSRAITLTLLYRKMSDDVWEA